MSSNYKKTPSAEQTKMKWQLLIHLGVIIISIFILFFGFHQMHQASLSRETLKGYKVQYPLFEKEHQSQSQQLKTLRSDVAKNKKVLQASKTDSFQKKKETSQLVYSQVKSSSDNILKYQRIISQQSLNKYLINGIFQADIPSEQTKQAQTQLSKVLTSDSQTVGTLNFYQVKKKQSLSYMIQTDLNQNDTNTVSVLFITKDEKGKILVEYNMDYNVLSKTFSNLQVILVNQE